jgi:hypothetical protein
MAISDKTLIPLGIAVLVIGGGATWMTTIHLATASNSAAMTEIKTTIPKTLEKIQEDIAEIKGELKRIKR